MSYWGHGGDGEPERVTPLPWTKTRAVGESSLSDLDQSQEARWDWCVEIQGPEAGLLDFYARCWAQKFWEGEFEVTPLPEKGTWRVSDGEEEEILTVTLEQRTAAPTARQIRKGYLPVPEYWAIVRVDEAQYVTEAGAVTRLLEQKFQKPVYISSVYTRDLVWTEEPGEKE
ncbi:MAG: hypothetical protein WC291_02635 [Thermodesulfovibrionales bacterium]|jgi:hypothetical protein